MDTGLLAESAVRSDSQLRAPGCGLLCGELRRSTAVTGTRPPSLGSRAFVTRIADHHRLSRERENPRHNVPVNRTWVPSRDSGAQGED